MTMHVWEMCLLHLVCIDRFRLNEVVWAWLIPSVQPSRLFEAIHHQVPRRIVLGFHEKNVLGQPPEISNR